MKIELNDDDIRNLIAKEFNVSTDEITFTAAEVYDIDLEREKTIISAEVLH